MIDWNIQSRSHTCQVTEKHFEEDEPYHTLLFRGKEGYNRLDICEDVWQEQYSDGATDRKGFISHWRGVYKAPSAKEPDPIERENAESLLRKIVELNDPKYCDCSYILAVMLERKRILKVQSEFEEEGRRVFVYERAKTGEVFTIADQQLDLDDMEKTQHDVALLLQHGLNTPAENEAADAEAEGGGETAPMDFSNNKETAEDSAADIDSPDSETPAESETDAVEEPAAT